MTEHSNMYLFRGCETLGDLTPEDGMGEARSCVLVDLHVVHTHTSKTTCDSLWNARLEADRHISETKAH